ncbi:tRNA pseudouridine(55) synthase TruB [Chlorogloea sp. CCALA 695]|uniref:tRNA pseudouridine(55) synthase TruB n=1 Tax=Chlorogloea sp. CCALA 695 TaxID=2107693 RepID=UPI000D079CBA|nr:tRNA pseudouridine(55) synthase TruB [Chlorogloea sp. CCALA 695]PSB35499.1 tRNA pseudouridine(55) synthase TruB [Chlorogloea sp. CCALA 695]
MQGFINLFKEANFTSHDCVAKLRGLLRLKRIGHGGTLDPAATGVLPIALGRATRLLQYLHPDKAYKATIRLGVVTETDDLEGEIISQTPEVKVSLEEVTETLKQFTGKLSQIPPKYSAIQVQGKRLYDLARRGETIEVPPRNVEVYKLEILEWRSGDYPEIDVAIDCSTGTYIRAIARDLGTVLGTGGTLAKLIRTQSAGFSLLDSLTFDELTLQLQQGSFRAIAPSAVLQHLPRATLILPLAQKWCQGQIVAGDEEVLSNCPVQVYLEDGDFLGIGHQEDLEVRRLIPDLVYEPM